MLLHNASVEHWPMVLAPHQATTTLCTFTADDFIQVKAKKLHTYVLVDITYNDRLDDSVMHKTEAEWELSLPLIDDNATHWGGAQWTNVGKHNCADEECPQD